MYFRKTAIPTLTSNSLKCRWSREGHVDVEPQTSPRADLLWPPGAGEKRPVVVAMEREIEDPRVVVEYLLSPVAMVNIL